MKLSNLEVVFQLNGVSPSFNHFIKSAFEAERQIQDIAAITKRSPADVKEFYQSHNYSLTYIKHVVLLCSELDEDKMKEAIIAEKIIAL
jgi:hypothetical protein